MQTLHLINTPLQMSTKEIDAKLARCNEIKELQKRLDVEYDKLKKELIAGYFVYHDTYYDIYGVPKCTYKPHKKQYWNTELFKEENPDMYDKYKKPEVIEYRFLPVK